MTTVLDIIDKGTLYLERRGIADARRNMQLLVAHQLGCSRMQLYVEFDRPLGDPELAPLRDLLKRRGEGTPLQHLTGAVDFHGRSFRCDARALIPRPETEELAELLLAAELPPETRALDMGCGSGVLGLTLAAERPQWSLTLADVSPAALELAAENAAALGLDAVGLVHSDLCADVSGDFDLIAANLPYVAESERAGLAPEVLHDPALALFGGPDGLDVIRRFIPQAFGRLRPGGLLALEIGAGQAAAVERLLDAAGFTEVRTQPDLSGTARFPFGRRPGNMI